MVGEVASLPRLVIEKEPTYVNISEGRREISSFSVRLEGVEGSWTQEDCRKIILEVQLVDQEGNNLLGTNIISTAHVSEGPDGKVSLRFPLHNFSVHDQGKYRYAAISRLWHCLQKLTST